MKRMLLSFLCVSYPFNSTAVSLEVADLPRAVTSKANGPDIGLVPAAMKLRYGKNASGKDNPLMFSFNLFTVNQLDILAWTKNGKMAVVSYAANNSKNIRLDRDVVDFLVKKNFPGSEWVKNPVADTSESFKSKDGRFSWALGPNRNQLVLTVKSDIAYHPKATTSTGGSHEKEVKHGAEGKLWKKTGSPNDPVYIVYLSEGRKSVKVGNPCKITGSPNNRVLAEGWVSSTLDDDDKDHGMIFIKLKTINRPVTAKMPSKGAGGDTVKIYTSKTSGKPRSVIEAEKKVNDPAQDRAKFGRQKDALNAFQKKDIAKAFPGFKDFVGAPKNIIQLFCFKEGPYQTTGKTWLYQCNHWDKDASEWQDTMVIEFNDAGKCSKVWFKNSNWKDKLTGMKQ